ncbi:putative protein kinase RLK-Pelle-DLSV family [Rosa chinensis]|uniref:Uncharacterized protein n=1 Tax=Rosa chinensis TaxID=74649 RepID=A0A2P6S5L5_ROSCH|nr:putative protein kinase RLK-Pelle-DLSV family [Rosa chinensis]
MLVLVGYLAPQYAIRGQVTKKADIYSFGVLVLEIASGRCNANRCLPSKEQYLFVRLLQLWELYERGQLVELADTSTLNEGLNVEEACRFVKIGLLCTQDKPKLRPSMSTVVKMLTGETDVDDEKIDKPGMLAEFMDQRDSVDAKHSSYSLSPYGRVLNLSSSSEKITTSFATMTFNSIFLHTTEDIMTAKKHLSGVVWYG